MSWQAKKNKKRFEANEKRKELFEKAHYRCEVCYSSLNSGVPQLAHRIPKTKYFLKKYGKEVIHHRFNLVTVESLRCNSSVNIGNNPMKVKSLVERILKDLEEK